MAPTTTTTRGLAAVAVVGLLGVAGCSSESDSGASESATKPSSAAPAKTKSSGDTAAKPRAKVTTLSVSDTSAGKAVVDDKGMTLYFFDKDKRGASKSACKGPCVAKWPAAHSDANSVELKGVSGKVTSVKGPDGKPQLALNGMPLYYFAKDKKAADAKGQGAMKVWWIVGADGKKVGG